MAGERERYLRVEALHHLAHVAHFVPAHVSHTKVEYVSTFLNLLLGKLHHAVVILGQQKLLELLRSVCVAPLAHNYRRRSEMQ